MIYFLLCFSGFGLFGTAIDAIDDDDDNEFAFENSTACIIGMAWCWLLA